MISWSIEKMCKVETALIKNKITVNEAILLAIEADNREYLAKRKREEDSSSLSTPNLTITHPTTPYHTGPHLT